MTDTREHQYSHITVNASGVELATLQHVAYKVTLNKEFIYGKGNKPRAIQDGNFSYEGSIGMLQSDLRKLQLLRGDREIQLLRGTNIIVVYQMDNLVLGEAPKLMTDILQGVRYGETEQRFNQGDTKMVIEIPIMFLDIKRL